MLTLLISRYYLFSDSESPLCIRQTVSDVDVEFICDVRYTGSIQPTILWSPENDDDQPSVRLTDGKLESRMTVSAADPAFWPKECKVTFNRQSCNEQRAAYTKTAKCPSEDGNISVSLGNSSRMRLKNLAKTADSRKLSAGCT